MAERMDNFEKIIEQQSRINEELKRMSETSKAHVAELNKAYNEFLSAIERNLIKWEKEIEEGKITDNTIIALIRSHRETFNAMCPKRPK